MLGVRRLLKSGHGGFLRVLENMSLVYWYAIYENVHLYINNTKIVQESS